MEHTDLRSGICPSCGHNEIIEASPGSSSAGTHLGLALYRLVSPPVVPELPSAGELWTYTCRRCGLTQWVVARPAEVLIGPEYKTRLITGRALQPFR
jgi:predicted RNA-binding Zn-ribbon protein involved in translation (DUF1610 family)